MQFWSRNPLKTYQENQQISEITKATIERCWSFGRYDKKVREDHQRWDWKMI